MKDIEKLSTELESLLAMDEDQLFKLLAKEVVPPTFKLFSPKEAIEAAKAWFEERKVILQERICTSVALRYSLYNTDRFDTVMTVATVMDLISTVVGIVPVNVVSVLIVKEGYPNFCKGYE